MEERIFLNAEQAKSVLLEGDSIHTFRNPSGGMMMGADWSRAKLEALLDKLPEGNIEIGGPTCKGMKHGLIAWVDGPLFIECDTAKLEALEQFLSKSM